MNQELIDDLIWRAGGDRHWYNNPKHPDLNDRIIGQDVLDKFAELIVQECAGIYSKIDNGNLHMGTDDYLEALHKTFRS